jgi:DNA-binding IclR family transcriptional regulator
LILKTWESGANGVGSFALAIGFRGWRTVEKLNSQERICEIIQLLHKNHVFGLMNKDLAVLVGTSEANICRDLGVLQKYQWIERGGRGTWRLSPEFSKIAGSIAKSYREAMLRLKEDEGRYTEGM